jgi:hypothetical protein
MITSRVEKTLSMRNLNHIVGEKILTRFSRNAEITMGFTSTVTTATFALCGLDRGS